MIICQPDRILLRQFVAKHAKMLSGTVLDAGGASRRYAHLFKHCTYRVLDINAEAKPDIIGSLESIPIPDNTIDGVVCTQVLGDVWNIEKAIHELLRIVKPGGYLMITESLFNEEHDEPHDYWRCTQFAWKKLLEEYTSIEILEPRGGFFTTMAQQKIRYGIEKYHLYHRPFLGRIANVWATLLTRWAMLRDSLDTSAASKKFPIGYCILAKKR